MAKITISDLRPAGAELICDSKSFINELTDEDMNGTHGGLGLIWIILFLTATPAY